MQAAPDDISVYRDGVRKLFALVQILAAVILALSVFLYYYMHSHIPQDRYFAEAASGAKIFRNLSRALRRVGNVPASIPFGAFDLFQTGRPHTLQFD